MCSLCKAKGHILQWKSHHLPANIRINPGKLMTLIFYGASLYTVLDPYAVMSFNSQQLAHAQYVLSGRKLTSTHAQYMRLCKVNGRPLDDT